MTDTQVDTLYKTTVNEYADMLRAEDFSEVQIESYLDEAMKTTGVENQKSAIVKLQEEMGNGNALRDGGKGGIIQDKYSDISVASVYFVNKADRLFENAKKVAPIKDYEDVVSHADADMFFAYTSDGLTEYTYSAKEFADMLCNSPNYSGGDIRLLACDAGAKQNGLAQQLADELGVNVLAPTQKVFIYPDGEMFLGSNLYTKKGMWIVFYPRR